MSDDWQVGDLALCVDASGTKRRLIEGMTYGIVKVGLTKTRQLGLGVDGILKPNGTPVCYYAWRFRKIRPDKHEPCEEEFVALLNKHRSKVPA